MSSMHELIVFLFITAGWCLITLAVRDIFVTVQMSVKAVREKNGQAFYYYSVSCRLISGLLQLINSRNRWRFILWRGNILFPVLQIILWNLLLITGFAFVYLAIDWKLRDELYAINLPEEFVSALWLSFTISVRFAPYNITPDDKLIYLIANIQFYLGFLFYAGVFLYLLTVRQKTKQMQPYLYGMEYALKKQYSPFNFSMCLEETYSSKEIIVILENWELWAERLRDNLMSFPPLIYSRPATGNRSWLASLNIILDTSAAIIVTADGTLQQKARRTLAISRHTLIEMANHLGVLPSGAKQISGKEFYFEYEDNVLSSELIFDMKEECSSTNRSDFRGETNPAPEEFEELELWQFTYNTSLTALFDYLNEEIPPQKNSHRNC